jgi:long-subunit fatty acid transport protein
VNNSWGIDLKRALAALFGLKGQSVTAMGTAYAGVAASDRGAADVIHNVIYNPAALMGVADAYISLSLVGWQASF